MPTIKRSALVEHAAARMFALVNDVRAYPRRFDWCRAAEVLEDIRRRDARDAGREAAPMRPAADAVLLDTSEMTIEQATDAARRIVEAARARWETS